MDLRAITLGLPLDTLVEPDILGSKLQKLLDDIKVGYAQKEISIRTFRINLPLITDVSGRGANTQNLIGVIDQVSKFCERLDIRWFNVPFDLSHLGQGHSSALFELAFETLKRFPKTFINIIVAADNIINYEAIDQASRFIKNVSRLDNSGYHNFRVGVSCNVKPNTPFFPFTFSSNELGFSIALELPREFTRVIRACNTGDLIVIREQIIDQLLPQIKTIEAIAQQSGEDNGITFHGIDVSLGPYPEPDSSVASLIEMLGIERQGSNGTLFLTAYLTDILKTLVKKGGIKSVGFGGVMYSLLEDEFMGKSNNNDTYSIDSLISYSAVCGCGLDMVPLPGDIFDEELSSIILDVVALSTVLDKPLGVRVLPIPMKQENEFTMFNMDFLFNTRIKKIKNQSLINSALKNKPFSLLNKEMGK
jgi:hypothetical protein